MPNDLMKQPESAQDYFMNIGTSMPGFKANSGALPQLKVTQGYDDTSLPKAPSTMFLAWKEKSGDEWVRSVFPVSKEDEKIEVRVVGARAARAYFDKPFGQGDGMPSCKSDTFFRPDTSVTEPISESCAMLNEYGRIVAVCPMAKFGEPDPKTGKSAPPKCKEQYVFGVVVSYVKDGERVAELAELVCKSTAASAGRKLFRTVMEMRNTGKKSWQYRVTLSVARTEIGKGYVIIPEIDLSKATDFDDETVAMFAEVEARWEDALKFVLARATSTHVAEPSAPPAEDVERPALPIPTSGSNIPDDVRVFCGLVDVTPKEHDDPDLTRKEVMDAVVNRQEAVAVTKLTVIKGKTGALGVYHPLMEGYYLVIPDLKTLGVNWSEPGVYECSFLMILKYGAKPGYLYVDQVM